MIQFFCIAGMIICVIIYATLTIGGETLEDRKDEDK